MKKAWVVLVLVLLLLGAVSCVPGPNELTNTPDDEGNVAGFWQGLFHGIIAPITFVISLFSPSVQMYEIFNNGNWYNFGFLVGMVIILGGGGGGAGRSSRR